MSTTHNFPRSIPLVIAKHFSLAYTVSRVGKPVLLEIFAWSSWRGAAVCFNLLLPVRVPVVGLCWTAITSVPCWWTGCCSVPLTGSAYNAHFSLARHYFRGVAQAAWRLAKMNLTALSVTECHAHACEWKNLYSESYWNNMRAVLLSYAICVIKEQTICSTQFTTLHVTIKW